MSKKSLTGAILLAASVVVLVGCEAKPKMVRRVDPSVLPASSKGLLEQDAQITGVEELTYSKGAKQYRIHYMTSDGKKRQILQSAATETTPTGVFEHAIN